MSWDATSETYFLDRYWPVFPVPSKILVTEPHTQLSFAESLLLQTLAGLVAVQTLRQGEGEMVWIGVDNPNYQEWFRRCVEYNKIPLDSRVYSVWELVDKFVAEKRIDGYLLCKRDTEKRLLYEDIPVEWSVNVATALCSSFRAVAVEEEIRDRVEQHGLRLLQDVRGKDETWLWNNYRGLFSPKLVGRQDPKNPVMRYELVAFEAPLASSVNELYETVLKATNPGSPVLGWGFGTEDCQTVLSSRHGIIQTATNWCLNLPLLSAGKTDLDYPVKSLECAVNEVPLEKDERAVSFILSDGDNVQWLMLNFCQGKEGSFYWGDSARGELPFGWTIAAVDLLQLCPYVLDYLQETRTEKDDFILYGGGYFYPDVYGEAKNRVTCLQNHAKRLRMYMKKTGLHLIQLICMDWDSPASIEAYEIFANEIPELEGIFVVQYTPYAAGEGQIKWVGELRKTKIPVISAKRALWGNRGNEPIENTPGVIARGLCDWANSQVIKSEDKFAWITVHAWSWFRQPSGQDGEQREENIDSPNWDDLPPDVARGFRPALWCAGLLPPNVRVVKPLELVRLLCREKSLESTRTAD